jgi:uracil-DNA glycosylase family 4
MSFFFNEARQEAKPARKSASRAEKGASRGHIPITAMRELGCRACPLDSDDGGARCHPKLAADLGPRPAVVVLTSAPNSWEDEQGRLGIGPANKAVSSYLNRFGVDHEFASTIRCTLGATPDDGDSRPAVNETECCRGMVEVDIARARPLVVVTVGDAALNWATGLNSADRFRGSPMPARIGGHVCWVYPVAFPKFALRVKKKTSEHERVLEADARELRRFLDADLTPVFVDRGFDTGITSIRGDEPGDMVRLEEALHRLSLAPKVGLDYETNALRPYHVADPMILTCAIGTFTDVVAFPIDHPLGWGTAERTRRARGNLVEFMLHSGTKIAHNLAFEHEWTEFFWGQDPLRLTEWGDTMAAAYVLDSREGTKSLGVQTRLAFGFNVKEKSTVDTKNIINANYDHVLRYNGMDSKWTVRLDDVQQERLARQGLTAVYERKLRLAPSLVSMQAKGMPCNRDFAESYLDELVERTRKIEAKIGRCPEIVDFEKRFGKFSPTAPDDVLKLLKDQLKRDEVKVTDWEGKVSYTTSEDVLSTISPNEIPSVPLILEHRGLEKLCGTYLRPLVSGKMIYSDGRAHTSYSQLKAVSGRLASEDPNLQNIPTRSAEGRRVREAFCSEQGGWIVAADYGQIEARVIGMASEDHNLMAYQWSDYDIHGFWAKRIYEEYPKVVDWVVATFKIDWDEKGLKTLRQEAKNKWVFPQFFGARTESCAADLHIPDHVAQTLGAEFWDEFKGVKKWQDKLIKDYERNLYVETLGGFRRRGVMTRNELINHPVQGTAAEIVTMAQCELSEMAYAEGDPELQPNLNVHDDLTSLLSDATLTAKTQRIVEVMCRHRFDFITVPLIVEVKVGKTWNKLEEVAVYKSHEIFNLRSPFA